METRVVAKVVVVNQDHEILLLRRSKDDERRPLQWDIPGGHTDGNEFAEEAAVRETREETGININPRSLRLLSTRTQMVTPELNVNWLFYVANANDNAVALSPEHVDYRWANLDEVLEAIDYEVQHNVFQYAKDNGLL